MCTKVFIAVFIAFAGIFNMTCICDKSVPVELKEEEEFWVDTWEPFIHPELVEDTTRVWMYPNPGTEGDTMKICPKLLYARFYPWVTDTNMIWQLLNQHNLFPFYNYIGTPSKESSSTFYALKLRVTDNRRAEYHFTPYGREGFYNFGADSLVEFAFFVFGDWCDTYPNGRMALKFQDNTPQSRIDSLFDSQGLRLRHIRHGEHRVFITKRAKRNVIDLGHYLNHIPCIEECWVDFAHPIIYPD
ncbi:MAG: hypothetical protein ABIL68_15860 [bacterium]